MKLYWKKLKLLLMMMTICRNVNCCLKLPENSKKEKSKPPSCFVTECIQCTCFFFFLFLKIYYYYFAGATSSPIHQINWRKVLSCMTIIMVVVFYYLFCGHVKEFILFSFSWFSENSNKCNHYRLLYESRNVCWRYLTTWSTNLISPCCTPKTKEHNWQIINMSVMPFCHGQAAYTWQVCAPSIQIMCTLWYQSAA